MGQQPSKENKPIKFNILSASAAADILEDAEARDEYREFVNESEWNRRARNNEIDWNPIDAPEHWKYFLSRATFPEWTANLEINIICSPPNAEGGMPHTRPNFIICIPSNYSRDEHEFNKMILHEIIHILQRVHHARFMQFMAAEWDYRLLTRTEFEKLPEHILQRRRINPDTLACPYLIWKDKWVPLIIFNEHIDGPRLTSTYLLWWNIRTGNGSMEPPYVWKEFFGKVPQSEHPFEMMAWYMSDATLQSEAAQKIREKFYELLVRK